MNLTIFILFVLILLIGLLLGWILSLKTKGLFISRTKVVDSTIVIEKIKSVCKLVNFEMNLKEIHEHLEKTKIFKLFTFDKKALIVISAKVLIGCDFSKLVYVTEKYSSKIRINIIPRLEVLAIDIHDLHFYHKTNNALIRFNEKEDEELYRQARAKIEERAKSFIETNKNKFRTQLIETVSNIAENTGWEIVFSSNESSETLEKDMAKIND